MVYKMIIYVDGACRGNGKPGAKGAFAAAWKRHWGEYTVRKEKLPPNSRPTNQRAELHALILALEMALEQEAKFYSNPRFCVSIFADSQYAVNCMNVWSVRWSQNGWKNAAGRDVANQDLIKKALALHAALKANPKARVWYVHVRRAMNKVADRSANEALDEQLEESDSTYYSR